MNSCMSSCFISDKYILYDRHQARYKDNILIEGIGRFTIIKRHKLEAFNQHLSVCGSYRNYYYELDYANGRNLAYSKGLIEPAPENEKFIKKFGKDDLQNVIVSPEELSFFVGELMPPQDFYDITSWMVICSGRESFIKPWPPKNPESEINVEFYTALL